MPWSEILNEIQGKVIYPSVLEYISALRIVSAPFCHKSATQAG